MTTSAVLLPFVSVLGTFGTVPTQNGKKEERDGFHLEAELSH